MREIEEVLNLEPDNGRLGFLALDHDIKSLKYVTSRFSDDRLKYGIANAFQMIKKNYRVAYPRRYALSGCNPRDDFKGFRKFFVPLRYEVKDLAHQKFRSDLFRRIV
ncbi:MAG: hypothetical protein U5R49_25285 [Deltaproteobacteria bacterium]|nr:hypothetical protein [Deltaproteobacteria bacterium]